jgi:hypothetical protein
VGTLVGVRLGLTCLPLGADAPLLLWGAASLAMIIYAVPLPEGYDIACGTFALCLVTMAVPASTQWQCDLRVHGKCCWVARLGLLRLSFFSLCAPEKSERVLLIRSLPIRIHRFQPSRSEHVAQVTMRIGKLRGNWKSPDAWLRENAIESRQLAKISMDNDFIQQFVCADCRLVYGEVLAFDSHPDGDPPICPRCGAGNGAVSTIECVYDTAWASLMRL